jgi:hypothetical protein
MGAYLNCRNCGNEKPGTSLYVCADGHRYCFTCADITGYDTLQVNCPVCKKDYKERYGTIAKIKHDPTDDNIDDFIDDDINDHDINDY